MNLITFGNIAEKVMAAVHRIDSNEILNVN